MSVKPTKKHKIRPLAIVTISSLFASSLFVYASPSDRLNIQSEINFLSYQTIEIIALALLVSILFRLKNKRINRLSSVTLSESVFDEEYKNNNGIRDNNSNDCERAKIIKEEIVADTVERCAVLSRLEREVEKARKRGTALSVFLVQIEKKLPRNQWLQNPAVQREQLFNLLCHEARSLDKIEQLDTYSYVLACPETQIQEAIGLATRILRRSSVLSFIDGDNDELISEGLIINICVTKWNKGEVSYDLLSRLNRGISQVLQSGNNRLVTLLS